MVLAGHYLCIKQGPQRGYPFSFTCICAASNQLRGDIIISACMVLLVDAAAVWTHALSAYERLVLAGAALIVLATHLSALRLAACMTSGALLLQCASASY